MLPGRVRASTRCATSSAGLALPVEAVDVPQHDALAGALQRADVARRSSAVRRTHQRRHDAGRARDRGIGRGELVLDRARSLQRQVRVRVRVVADLVAVARDPRRELGVRVDLLAEQEERRGHAELGERVEQRGRALRIGPVIERQRDEAVIARAVRIGVHGPVDRPLDAAVAEQVREPDRGGRAERSEQQWQHALARCEPGAGGAPEARRAVARRVSDLSTFESVRAPRRCVA